MRILLGIDTLGLIGGSERYALSLATALAQHGHEVAILCGEKRADAPAATRTFVHTVYSSKHVEAGELDAFERDVLDFAPDVVLSLSSRGRAAIERLTELSPRAPLVRFVQDHTLFCPGLNKLLADGSPCELAMGATCLDHYYLGEGCFGFRRQLHRRALDGVGGVWKWMRGLELAKRASRLLVASQYMRRELVAVGCDPTRVDVVPYFTLSNSRDLEVRAPDRATREFVEQSRVPVLFTPARLALPDKGVDFLLTALGRVAAPFRAVIAGSGPAEAWLRTKALEEELGDRVHFAGWQDSAAIEWLYSRASLVVFPSVWDEPFGLVGLEAMAHGRPVVAFDVGGVREWLVENETGLLAPRKDVEHLTRAIDRVLGDAQLAAKLGSNGRARAIGELSRDAHLAKLELILESARR